jgi:nucleosome binding factor SPN SPT16 subunit
LQPKIGSLPKETPQGSFAQTWNKVISENTVDIAAALANLFAIKDIGEIVCY